MSNRLTPTRMALTASLAVVALGAAILPAQAAPLTDPAPATAVAAPSVDVPLRPVAGVAATDDTAVCGSIATPDSIDGLKPGDLVGSQPLTPGEESPGVPLLTGAQSWRILYISAGVDETSPQLVCGLVTAPADWAPTDGVGRVIAWAHGTVGAKQKCQPSNNPDKGFFGAMPGGLGAVSWSTSLVDKTTGLASNGALQTFIDQGYVVAATDYYSGITPGTDKQGPLQHYAAGFPSGANVLDSVRAAVALVDDSGSASRWDMMTWGHSQGGGSALWAGQLARAYLAKTTPTNPVAPIRLVGVAAAAPATSFAAPSTAKTQLEGYHLGDLDMHMNVDLAYNKAINIGSILFSYVLPNWAELSSTPATPGALFPAMPAGPTLRLESMLASKSSAPNLNNVGLDSAPVMATMCLNTKEGEGAIALFAYFYGSNPVRNMYFIPEIWGTAADGYTKGRLDYTCATSTDAGIQQWCRWLRYNQPGPNGQNPFDKVPRNESGPVPIYIMQGEADNILYCMPADPSSPQAKECLAKQFYESMKPAYCPSRGPASGSLQVDFWPKQVKTGVINHPASHMSIPGQAAAPVDFPGTAGSFPDLKFTDSPLYAFVNAAFTNAKSLPRGCSQRIMFANQ